LLAELFRQHTRTPTRKHRKRAGGKRERARRNKHKSEKGIERDKNKGDTNDYDAYMNEKIPLVVNGNSEQVQTHVNGNIQDIQHIDAQMRRRNDK
jgi:hypothetical protein